jgi:integrase
MLTDASIRKIKPADKDRKVADSGGLYLFVTKAGHRSWRLKYRLDGKERVHVLGSYPDVSLAAAREMRDQAKRLIREGRDPNYERKKEKLADAAKHGHLFKALALEWYELQKPRWKPVHADDVITSLERDIFPKLGEFAIADIDKPMVLAVLRAVENRGAVETAKRLRQRLGAIFDHAEAAGLTTINPAHVTKLLKKASSGRRWPALLDLSRIRGLIAAVDDAGANPVTKLASRLIALTAQRPGMVRRAPWSEFEEIEWDRPEARAPDAVWRIPAERMKLEMDMREDETFEHLVPLTPEAVDVLHAVRRLTGLGPLAFPNNRSAAVPLSENAVGYLYNRLGYKGRHVPHGWRSSFSTLMNGHFASLYPVGTKRQMMAERLYIDLMLAHVPEGMSAAELRYNRNEYMKQRREIAELWASWIMEGRKSAHELLDGPRRPLSRTR